jgi:hypothetical protein
MMARCYPIRAPVSGMLPVAIHVVKCYVVRGEEALDHQAPGLRIMRKAVPL